jgi:hypothetical protein
MDLVPGKRRNLPSHFGAAGLYRFADKTYVCPGDLKPYTYRLTIDNSDETGIQQETSERLLGCYYRRYAEEVFR